MTTILGLGLVWLLAMHARWSGHVLSTWEHALDKDVRLNMTCAGFSHCRTCCWHRFLCRQPHACTSIGDQLVLVNSLLPSACGPSCLWLARCCECHSLGHIHCKIFPASSIVAYRQMVSSSGSVQLDNHCIDCKPCPCASHVVYCVEKCVSQLGQSIACMLGTLASKVHGALGSLRSSKRHAAGWQQIALCCQELA